MLLPKQYNTAMKAGVLHPAVDLWVVSTEDEGESACCHVLSGPRCYDATWLQNIDLVYLT